ncbi:MAG: 4-alpha-glucanotransferase [Rhodoferax sp.]
MRFPRASGLLLHITSLPGPHGSGDFGPAAYHFVDWLHTAGQSLWQILPLTPIGAGHSPYMSCSAFAGNVLLVDLGELHARGWLLADEVLPLTSPDTAPVEFATVIPWRMQRLERAFDRFMQLASDAELAEFHSFCLSQAAWLDDYALFMALEEQFQGRLWPTWEKDLARREPAALQAARRTHATRVSFWQFGQWCFWRQWQALRRYAHAKGVRLIGDMPIFMAHHSAEVWAHPELFELDPQGQPTVVAGVPPDYFSATGQRWGNPLYRWQAHVQDGFQWWIDRIRHSVTLVDIVRIDHFRGFESHWEIPVHEETAIHGRWVPGCGDALFNAVRAALGELPIIAEDLGVITPAVQALREQHGFPGMRILQFAWGEHGDGEPRYLPHRYSPDTVVYTGSHDNDTAWGWWASQSEPVRHHLREYLASNGSDVSWDLIRTASASVADMAIFPLQDVLNLGSEHRMNRPGTPTGNWAWRFHWGMVEPWHAQRLYRMAELYQRLPSHAERSANAAQ